MEPEARKCQYCGKPILVIPGERRKRIYCSTKCKNNAALARKEQRQQEEIEQARLESMRTLDEREQELNAQIEALNMKIKADAEIIRVGRVKEESERVFRDKVRQVCRELDFGLTHKALIFNPQSPYYQQFMQLQNWGQFVHAWANGNIEEESIYDAEEQYWRLEQEWTRTIHLCIMAARKAGAEKDEYYSSELTRLQRERKAWREQYFKDHPRVKALKELRYTIDEIRDLEGQEPSPYDPRLEPLFREAFGFVLMELPREKPAWAHY